VRPRGRDGYTRGRRALGVERINVALGVDKKPEPSIAVVATSRVLAVSSPFGTVTILILATLPRRNIILFLGRHACITECLSKKTPGCSHPFLTINT
jgi:hypothetical protein